MSFLLRVFSRGREVPRHVAELQEEFQLRKHEVSRVLLQNAEVRGFVEMIFDDSDQDTKLFLLSPSPSSLKENEDVVSKILSCLALQSASLFGRLSGAVEQHGVETVSDIVLHVLKLLSNLLDGKHIDLGDDLLESLDFAWQLSSPLSGKPKVQFNIRQQSISRQELRASFRFQDDDGIKKITPYMEEAPQLSNNEEKLRDQEQEADPPKRDQNISAVEEFVPAHPQVQGPGDKEEAKLLRNSDRDTGLQTIMRVAATGSRASSVNNSRRISYAGSELYTTDSDDDSLSTCSHTSLMVAVSEAPDDSEVSSSGDGSEVLILEPENMEPVDVVVCDASFGGKDQPADDSSKVIEIPFPSGSSSVEDVGDESAEDKLPICSSVVLSRRNSSAENDLSQESFYAPEMWTYSVDKDASEFEAALSHGGGEKDDDNLLLKNFNSSIDDEQKKEVLEEVRVVISFDGGEHVMVSVHPVPPRDLGDVTSSFIDAGSDRGRDKVEKVVSSEAPEETVDNVDNSEVIPPEKHTEAGKDDSEAYVTGDILVEKKADKVQNAVAEDKQETTPGEGDTSVTQNSSSDDSLEKWTEESSAAATGESDEKRGENTDLDKFESLIEEKHTEEAADEGNTDDGDGTEGLPAATEAIPYGNLTEESADEKQQLTEESDGVVAQRTSTSDMITASDSVKSETAVKHPDSATVRSENSKSSEAPGPESLLYSGGIPLSGPIVYNAHSGPIPYSGSLSLRSDSSTTSTRSFAFPLLSGEWTSSPVKMPPPERIYSRHRRPRSWRSLCCFCSVK